LAKRVRVSRQRRAQGCNGCTAPMPSRLRCKPVEVMIIAMVAPLGAGGREEQAGRLAVRAGKSHCWIGHRRIISASAENRGNSCQRKHPAEILALGPSCASHRRSSNTNSLCGRNSAGSPEICATFSKGYFATTFLEFESSHLSQPVRSLRAMSGLQKYVRHSRELARPHVVSDA
jgi:hypothetical protein